MNLVACPRCGAQFDVSSFAPGSSFVCGACQNTLQVPAAVAAPVAQPVAQPVARPVAPAAKPAAAPPAAAPSPAMMQKKPAVDPRRAGGAAPAAAGPGRAQRIRQQREEGGEAAKKKNPLPLVLAGVAAVALLGVGISMAMKKKEAPPDAGGAGAGGAGAGAETAKAPAGGGAAPDAGGEKSFESLPKSKQLEIVEQKVKDAGKGAAAAKESYEWLSGKGMAADAQRALTAGHLAAPGDAWINGKLGLVDRAGDVRALANDENITFNVSEENPDLQRVLTLNEKIKGDPAAGWLTADQSKSFDEAATKLRETVAKLSDPVYARTKKEFDNVRLNPAFTGREFSFESYRPYVIFAELPGEDKRELADRVVRITGRALQFVYKRWIDFMKTDMGMNAPTLEEQGDDRLKVFVFKSRESFDAWHTKSGIPNPGPSVAAYYEHGRDRMIMMHLDAFDPGVIMHEATHQIIHYYARHFCQVDDDAIAEKDGEPKEAVRYDDSRLRSTMFWFQEGIAEYFGGADPVPGKEGEWTIGALQRERLGFFKFMQKRGSLWSLDDFLFADQVQITNRAKVKGGGLQGDELKGLMYSQGWTLVHFFLEGGGGKYRERFLKLMKNELSGRSGKPYLLEAFGLPKRTDDPKFKEFIDEVEVGYMKYFEELFQRMMKEMAGGK